ncbi:MULTISPECIES: WXG100 family type VII secretion target [Streptacidiphilus]|uniref:WXG100 family type VII secretion target n=1 Tax=Streptacidiphilus cavernicola TaxID=3342716 RepID=A0ABV6ULN9_9ACTN|nr:WXG100 family type VII secretion target [Streptacidiphilus jeojiense]
MDVIEGGGLAVRPEVLDAEASALNSAALQVESAVRRGLGEIAAAGGALAGWRAGAALEECAAAWAVRLAAVVAALDGHAGRLRVSARNYREADAAVRASMAIQPVLP